MSALMTVCLRLDCTISATWRTAPSPDVHNLKQRVQSRGADFGRLHVPSKCHCRGGLLICPKLVHGQTHIELLEKQSVLEGVFGVAQRDNAPAHGPAGGPQTGRGFWETAFADAEPRAAPAQQEWNAMLITL